MRKYRKLKITDKKRWGNNYLSLFFEDKEITDKVFPGNFFMIKVGNFYKNILPRPFSIARVFPEKSVFEIFFQVVGDGTKILSEYNEGDEVEILGPVGNRFPVNNDKKNILVAGGRGISPFLYLSKILKSENIDFTLFYGGKSEKDLMFKDYLSEFDTIFITETGDFGQKGLITEYLPEGDFNIMTCGPDIMMKKVYEFYENSDSSVFVSLEERMGCGTGICYGCAKKIITPEGVKMVRICQEGPVFDGGKVVWDE